MLRVHHLNNSRSQRIVWLLEELGLPYELVVHQRDPETQRSPASLSSVHPLGKSPAIEHDGQVIVETDAIIHYVTNKLAGGRLAVGPDAPEYGAYLSWLAFPEGSMMGPLVFDLVYQWTGGGNELLHGFFDAEIVRHQAYLEAAVANRDFLLQSGFSAADVNLGWTLEFAECRRRMADYPQLAAYLARLRARPAYRRALERGGPQDLSVFG
ncbi:MAG: glutathione S-transferase [Gammaproteobacteria bacterium]|nr:glutathione S-transferase [Gammaproteobacteria bacterium]